MSSVLHPAGPEPAQTYWVRRALVLVAAIVVLVLIIVVIVNLFRTNSASASGPGGVPPAAPIATSDSTPTPASTPSPTPTATPTSPWASPESTTPTSTRSPDTQRAATTAPSSGAVTPTARPRGSLPCDPATLRPTLRGQPLVKVSKPTEFDLSLINGSTVGCRLVVDPTSFELKIYSGLDPIWSSSDCAKTVPVKVVTLRSQDALAWKMVWNGQRSTKGCQTRPQTPRPGTYIATAQFSGAKPVQFRMVLHG
jgi:hypothetical protein